MPTVVNLLPAGYTWKFYGDKLPPVAGQIWSMFDAVDHLRNTSAWQEHVRGLAVNATVRQRLDAASGSILSGRSEALQKLANALPGGTAARIHEAALQSFVHGMTRALYVGAALTACAAILAAVAQVRIAPAHATQPAGAVEL